MGEKVSLAGQLSPLDYVFRAVALGCVPGIGLLAYDLIQHPNTPGIAGQPFLFRIFLGLTIAPVVIAVAALVLRRVPGNSVGRFLLLLGTLEIGGQFGFDLGSPPVSSVGLALFIIYAGGIAVPSLVYLLLTFPTGKVYPPQWARPVMFLGVARFLGVLLQILASPGDIEIFRLGVNPLYVPALRPLAPFIIPTFGLRGLILLVGGAAGMISLILRYRASSEQERQQIKWVVWASGLLLLTLTSVVVVLFNGALSDPPLVIPLVLGAFAHLLLISSIAVAILRYRLFDIDLVINRSLVYGSLTVIVIGVYAAVVGSLGMLFQSGGNLVISLLATALVAILFQPLRERLQRAVNRFVYGERDDPYAALSRLGERLEATLAPDAILPAIVETVAQALKLPYVAIELTDVGGQRTEASFPSGPVSPRSDLIGVPLNYQHDIIGELLLAPRAPGEPFTRADRRLLDDFARQAGIAAHAVRLTRDLQRSRERLVTAREEERRRIRRNLHDGLGPALASLTLKMDAARNLLPRDQAATDQLLLQLKAQTQTAIADIRHLVYDLRPPALDELGLVPAIRAYVMQYDYLNGLRVCVDAPEEMSPLPAAVEVAAYRIIMEGVMNVVRHAGAQGCVVSLCLRDALEIRVEDDGRGIPDKLHAGVGLASMRERAAELGGLFQIQPRQGRGTCILARLPVTT